MCRDHGVFRDNQDRTQIALDDAILMLRSGKYLCCFYWGEDLSDLPITKRLMTLLSSRLEKEIESSPHGLFNMYHNHPKADINAEMFITFLESIKEMQIPSKELDDDKDTQFMRRDSEMIVGTWQGRCVLMYERSIEKYVTEQRYGYLPTIDRNGLLLDRTKQHFKIQGASLTQEQFNAMSKEIDAKMIYTVCTDYPIPTRR